MVNRIGGGQLSKINVLSWGYHIMGVGVSFYGGGFFYLDPNGNCPFPPLMMSGRHSLLILLNLFKCLKSWFRAGIFTQDDLTKALDQLQEAWPVAPSRTYVYIFSGLYINSLPILPNVLIFFYRTISQLIWTVWTIVHFDNFLNS